MCHRMLLGFMCAFIAISSSFADEDVLEKAWACKPSLIKRAISKTVAPSDIFQFEKCDELSDEDKNLLKVTLFEKYRDEPDDSNSEWDLYRFLVAKTDRFLVAKEEKSKKEERLAAEAKRVKEALHQQQLKEGLIRPQNMQDVWLLYKTGDTDGVKNLHRVMAGALLQPDNAIYGAQVEIDSQESSGALLAKFEPGSFLTKPGQTMVEAAGDANLMIFASKLTGKAVPPELQNGTRHYAQLNRNKATVNFSPNLRIGSSVWVVGRYKANRQYRMTNGASRTMPVLDVLYIGE